MDKLRASRRGVYPWPCAPSQLRGSHRTSLLLHQGQEKVPLPAGLPPGGRLSTSSQARGLAWLGSPGKAALPPCVDPQGCPWTTHGGSVLCSWDRKWACGGRAAGAGAAGAPVRLGTQAVWAHNPPTPVSSSLTCVGGARLDVSRQGGATARRNHEQPAEPRGTSAWVGGRPRRARPGPRGPRLESEAPSGKSPACTPRKARPSAPRLCAEALPAPAQRSSAALGNTTGPAVGVEGGQGPSPSAWSLGVCAVGGPSVRGLAKWGGEESHWVIPSVHRVSGAGI